MPQHRAYTAVRIIIVMLCSAILTLFTYFAWLGTLASSTLLYIICHSSPAASICSVPFSYVLFCFVLPASSQLPLSLLFVCAALSLSHLHVFFADADHTFLNMLSIYLPSEKRKAVPLQGPLQPLYYPSFVANFLAMIPRHTRNPKSITRLLYPQGSWPFFCSLVCSYLCTVLGWGGDPMEKHVKKWREKMTMKMTSVPRRACFLKSSEQFLSMKRIA